MLSAWVIVLFDVVVFSQFSRWPCFVCVCEIFTCKYFQSYNCVFVHVASTLKQFFAESHILFGRFYFDFKQVFSDCRFFCAIAFHGFMCFYKLAFNCCIVIFACRGPPKELRNSLLTLRICVFS